MPVQVRLYCTLCDIVDCPFRRAYVSVDSEEGCLRELSDDLYTQYYHYTEEVLPFCHLRGVKWGDQMSNYFISLMNEEVAYTPLIHKYNFYGKAELAPSRE